MTVVIETRGLSKRYRKGAWGHSRLSEMAAGAARHAWNALRRRSSMQPSEPAADTDQEFWALRNIDLSVRDGEVVGLLGRNGAGKSTLLKLLTRIVHPTNGSFRIRGRIASLLEVG